MEVGLVVEAVVVALPVRLAEKEPMEILGHLLELPFRIPVLIGQQPRRCMVQAEALVLILIPFARRAVEVLAALEE